MTGEREKVESDYDSKRERERWGIITTERERDYYGKEKERVIMTAKERMRVIMIASRERKW